MPRPSYATKPVGSRRLLAVGAMMLVTMLATLPVGAQELDPNRPPPANDYVSCGHFETQEDAQGTLDSGELDATGRESLDGDGDGIACEVRWGEPSTGATETTTVAVQLPNTGAGVTAASSERGMMAAGVMLVSGVTLLVGRRLARR